MPRALRTGWTTGTTAAAAAKAAALLLAGQGKSSAVEVPLPAGGRLEVPVHAVWALPSGAEAVAIKDAGDDPDVTHGARIHAQVLWEETGAAVRIEGGPGVGRVTRPGLGLPVGEAAINPGPQTQIAAAVREVLPTGGIRIVISVEDGEALAQRTLNPRLGIVGGISILGTRGTVLPLSHAAWRGTIRAELAVFRAAGHQRVLFTTGGRSEAFFRHHMGDDLPAIQVADHVAFALREAARQGYGAVTWAVFLGKLLKQAQGMACTHARFGSANLAWLTTLAQAHDIDLPLASCPTALAAQELLRRHPKAPALYHDLMAHAARHARRLARAPLQLGYLLFHRDGTLLAQWSMP